jgi:hypothetical protein
MKDMQASLEKLRADATEAALISELATDTAKRELFARLSIHQQRSPQRLSARLRHGWRMRSKAGNKARAVGG